MSMVYEIPIKRLVFFSGCAHCTSASECHSWFSSSGYSFVVSAGSSRSCGCVILYRPSLILSNSWHDDHGRFLQCEFSFQSESFRVVCLYAPNRNPDRDQFFDEVPYMLTPLFSWEISTQFSINLSIWSGLPFTILHVRAPRPFPGSLIIAVVLTSGVIYTHLVPVLPGPDRVVSFLLASI